MAGRQAIAGADDNLLRQRPAAKTVMKLPGEMRTALKGPAKDKRNAMDKVAVRCPTNRANSKLSTKRPLQKGADFCAFNDLTIQKNSVMTIIATIIIGLIVGFLARALKPGNDSLGWIMTAVLGIAGSFLASYVGSAMGWYAPGQVAGFLASVVGAVVLLVIYSLVAGHR